MRPYHKLVALVTMSKIRMVGAGEEESFGSHPVTELGICATVVPEHIPADFVILFACNGLCSVITEETGSQPLLERVFAWTTNRLVHDYCVQNQQRCAKFPIIFLSKRGSARF